MAQHGSAKLTEDYAKMSASTCHYRDISKPSSATTACTFAASEYSMRNDLSSLAKNKREQKSDKKFYKDKKIVGTKRPSQLSIGKPPFLNKLLNRSN